MKKILMIIAVLSVSKSVMASHAYGTDSCVAKTSTGASVEFEFSNTGPIDPHKISLRRYSADELSSAGIKQDEILWVNLDQSADSPDEPAATSSLVLKVKSDDVFEKHKMTGDECFMGEAWKSTRKTTVLSVDKKAAALFGMKRGETLEFSCYGDQQTPSGAKGC